MPQQPHDPPARAAQSRLAGFLPALVVLVLVFILVDLGASRVLAGCGLAARYFTDAASTSAPVLTTLEPAPSPVLLRRRLRLDPGLRSVQWDGHLAVDRSQAYVFSLVSGGRTTLSLDGRTLLRVSATPGVRQYSPPVSLTAGPHRLQVRHAPLTGPELELSWGVGESRLWPLRRDALSPQPASSGERRLRRIAGALAQWARPGWVAGLVAWWSVALVRLAARRAAARGRPLGGSDLLLLLGFSGFVLLTLFVISGAASALWPGLEWQPRPLVLALAFYALLPWLVLRSYRSLRRAGWPTVALGACSLAVALGLGEVILRRWRPYDSLPRFRWIASSTCHHLNPPGRRLFSGWAGGAPVTVETNEDGLRSTRSREAFLGHRTRILVLGDSFAFGSGVGGEQAFPARLEEYLRHALGRDDLAVANAGVIGFSPFLEEPLLEQLLPRYRPTLVVLQLDATDIGDDDIYARSSRSRDGAPYFDAQGETRLRYWGALHQLLQPLLAWMGQALAHPWTVAAQALGLRGEPAGEGFNYYVLPIEVEGVLDNRFFIYRHPLSVTRPFFEATLGNIRRIAQRVRESGAGFVLVVAPRYHHWSRRECPQNWERAYGTDEPFQYEYFRFFEESRGQPDLPILDLLPAFQATDEFPLVFPNDPHWNEQGHAFVARTLGDQLLRSGLLREPPP